MNFKKIAIFLITLLITGFLSYWVTVGPALANDFDPSVTIGRPEEVKVTEFGPMLRGVIKVAFFVAVLLCFLFLLWGGIQWILSGGDKAKYEEARNRITAAVIGVAIVALAWLIMKLVTWFFGLPDIFGSEGKPFTFPQAF